MTKTLVSILLQEAQLFKIINLNNTVKQEKIFQKIDIDFMPPFFNIFKEFLLKNQLMGKNSQV